MTKLAVVALLALLACKKDSAEPPPTAEPPRKAEPSATAPADAAAAVVVAPAPTGDAGVDACDAHKDKGMDSTNMGQHAEALGHFEASLKCRPDPYLVQLAFMSSCNSGNSPKAKEYFKQLTPAQQGKFKVMCTRNKVAYE